MTETASTAAEKLEGGSTGNTFLWSSIFQGNVTRHREEFHVYFDAQPVDKIWDCTAILQVFYYDSKNLSQYISAWIGHEVSLTIIVHLRVTWESKE